MTIPLNFITSPLPFIHNHPFSSPSTSPKSRHGILMAASLPLRIGHGYDLHRLEPGLPLILGGVTLEHDRGCAGHSDGDAIYHCVVDAVLGALSLPDIGQLFPDTDPRFKGCDSGVFMKAAWEKMREKGYVIGNVDVTIILERPKMAPHKEMIRGNLARLLETDMENVNIKAKTHEKVDAVGENRAVEVHAVAMLVGDGKMEEEGKDLGGMESIKGEARSVVGGLLGVVGKRVGEMGAGAGVVDRLYETVVSRKGGDVESSWTAKLFAKGRGKIAQKVGEEAVEVVIDACEGNGEGVVKESADLLYHLSVLWADMGIRPGDVWEELERREGSSGIKEKASRVA